MKLRDRRQLTLDLPTVVVGVGYIDPPLTAADDLRTLDVILGYLNKHPQSFTGQRFTHRGSMVHLLRLRVR